MLTELHTESIKDGLKMHVGKTKVIFNNYADKKEIIVDNKEIEILEEYIYLGKVARIDEGMNVDLNRGLLSRWNAFRKHASVKRKFAINHKRKVFNQCILLVIIYDCKTWPITKRLESKLLLAMG